MSQKSLAGILKAVDVVTVVCSCILAAYAVPRVMRVLLGSGVDVAAIVGSVAFSLPLVAMGAAGWGVFAHIGKGASFSDANVRLLGIAAVACAVEALLFFAMATLAVILPAVGLVLGLAVLGLLFVSGAVCLAALSQLTHHAAKIKDENDLTV